jgi:hypothetical protein
VVSHASVKKIPLFMIHSSGVSSLRGCIENCCRGGNASPELCGSCPAAQRGKA